MQKIIRLGTRASPLALIQAKEVKERLSEALALSGVEAALEIIPLRTSGDWKPENEERSFVELGGNKELFTKEIEEALVSKRIDLAVHSVKDMSTSLPHGLELGAVLKRGDPRDAFISLKALSLDQLPSGSIIGTSSPRRHAQILLHRPDLKVTSLRGNVETRIQKLSLGRVDAIILAVAGVYRLGLENKISSIISTDTMLPAAGQGAVGLEIRTQDQDIRELIKRIGCQESYLSVLAERALLHTLGGSCKTPIGAFAHISHGRCELAGLLIKPDGSSLIRLQQSGPLDAPETLGTELGLKLKEQMPLDFFSA